MTTEYRIIFTATFATAAERDKAYTALKTVVAGAAFKAGATFKRADLVKDDYAINDRATEQVI